MWCEISNVSPLETSQLVCGRLESFFLHLHDIINVSSYLMQKDQFTPKINFKIQDYLSPPHSQIKSLHPLHFSFTVLSHSQIIAVVLHCSLYVDRSPFKLYTLTSRCWWCVAVDWQWYPVWRLDFFAPPFEIEASIKAKVCYVFCFIFHCSFPYCRPSESMLKALHF